MSKASQDLDTLNDVGFLESFSLDETMLTLCIEGVDYTVLLPDEYPSGEPTILGDHSEVLRGGNLLFIAEQVLTLHRGWSGSGTGEYYEESPYMSREPTMMDGGLANDIEIYKGHFGPSSVSNRSLEMADWITIDIPIGTIISEAVAKAWGVSRSEPISCELRFDTKQYIEQSKPPRVQFLQGGNKFPLGQQMTRALRLYLERNWERSWTPNQTASGCGCSGSESADLPPNKMEIFKQLMDMAFEEDFAREAARHCRTVEEALDFDPSSVPKFTEVSQPDTLTAAEVFANPEATRYDESQDPAKFTPYNAAAGFLVHIAEWLKKRIPTSSKFCVICDQPHLFGSANMVRAAVCTRDVCVFAYHELSIGSDAAESVATDAGVVDLLVCVFLNAAGSSRKENILKPFPQVPHPMHRDKLALDPAKPDFKTLERALKAFPTVEQLVKSRDLVSLKEQLTSRDELAYPLLEWVISSNRSHIVKMQENHQLKTMNTKHQFLLLTAAPEKEAKFNQLKAKHGTKFAFHGSRAENWHAILRNGLKNMSGTSGQLNGAAHGSGIYFAPQASSSLGYCSTSGQGKQSSAEGFISESQMICLALCELIDTPEVKDHGWCWTLANEDHVVTRFFFVYDNNTHQGNAGGADVSNKNFRKEITEALKYYGL